MEYNKKIIYINYDEMNLLTYSNDPDINIYMKSINELIKKNDEPFLIIVCTQNSIASPSIIEGHHFQNILGKEIIKTGKYDIFSKIDANHPFFLYSKKSNLRTRIYYNLDKVDFLLDKKILDDIKKKSKFHEVKNTESQLYTNNYSCNVKNINNIISKISKTNESEHKVFIYGYNFIRETPYNIENLKGYINCKIHYVMFTPREINTSNISKGIINIQNNSDLTVTVENILNKNSKSRNTINTENYNTILSEQNINRNFEIKQLEIGMTHRLLMNISNNNYERKENNKKLINFKEKYKLKINNNTNNNNNL
jgi:hypothetical protein